MLLCALRPPTYVYERLAPQNGHAVGLFADFPSVHSVSQDGHFIFVLAVAVCLPAPAPNAAYFSTSCLKCSISVLA